MLRHTSLILILSSIAAFAQPRLSNAKLETRAVNGSLEAAVQSISGGQSGPAWVGYAVPSLPGERQMCCYYNESRGCGLEGKPTGVVSASGPAKVHLEGPREVLVLHRIENRQVGKVRVYSPDCELDAGGLPFYWLTGVRSADSLRLLRGLVPKDGESHKDLGIVPAIALHGDPLADRMLDELAAAGQPQAVRKDALFWLANSRGAHGFDAVRRVLQQDSDDKLREHATFLLTLTKEPGGLPLLIDTAKQDRSPRVRGQALFWLAQKAGQRAAATITDAVENDPDTEVKKKAVFALSQLPKDEGVPKLIDVARAHKNPAVRKQAMFWLGQSHDPRALQFFEQVLTK